MAPQKYYTVGVSNKFSAFDSDGGISSDDEVILPTAPQKESESEVAKNQARKKPELKEEELSSRRSKREPVGYLLGRGNFRGGRGGSNGAAGQQFERQRDVSSMEITNGVKPARVRNVDGRGRGGERGRFVGRNREYDRHSGTGRGGEFKKGGGGGHNWGNEGQDFGASLELKTKPERLDSGVSNDDSPVEESQNENIDGNIKTNEAEVEEEGASKKLEPKTIDLDSYKAQQASKRTNLPSFGNKKPSAKITTEKELEAQGYTRHVKETSDGESDCEEGGEVLSEDEKDERKKKTMNVFEYIHNEGGRVRLFPARRGRGGRDGEGFSGGRGGGRGGRMTKGRDAPDIQDERAFPKLG